MAYNVPRLMRSGGKRSGAEFDDISHQALLSEVSRALASDTEENSGARRGTLSKMERAERATFWITLRVSEVFLKRSEGKIWVEALERAVTGYSLLDDVIKSFCFAKQNIIWG